VFKIITASALLEAGLGPDTRTCYSGGSHRLSTADLDGEGRQCATLTEALGGSINTVFAKLADRHLNSQRLVRYASAFGYGQTLPFDAPTQPSPAEVPVDRLEFARTAAGFWHTQLSPLHAAMIAATIANGGVMQRASMIDRVVDGQGNVVSQREPSAFRSVIERRTAEQVSRMMERTVTHGTAHSAFYDEHGTPFLPGIRVAGKTGSLDQNSPYRAYSWWVGHAPADHPTIAIAALVVNTPLWRIKGSFLAREALRHYLVEKPARERRELSSR
jgi:cell division protein FtsI/penicillin-binding protein 2